MGNFFMMSAVCSKVIHSVSGIFSSRAFKFTSCRPAFQSRTLAFQPVFQGRPDLENLSGDLPAVYSQL